MNRSAAHTRLLKEILIAVGSLPGVIAGYNPCGVAKYPRREDPMKYFAVPYGWPTSEGGPDLLIAVDGRLLAAEGKTGDADTTNEQKRCHEALRAAGVKVVVARSVEDVVRAIGGMRRAAA